MVAAVPHMTKAGATKIVHFCAKLSHELPNCTDLKQGLDEYVHNTNINTNNGIPKARLTRRMHIDPGTRQSKTSTHSDFSTMASFGYFFFALHEYTAGLLHWCVGEYTPSTHISLQTSFTF